MTGNLTTNDPDDYPHSPGVLVVPTEEDVNVVRRMLNEEYDEIREDYENPNSERMSGRYAERVERKGSLIQELLAQLRAIENE
jgi:hypothetical protein